MTDGGLRLRLKGTDGAIAFDHAADAALFQRVAHHWPTVAPDAAPPDPIAELRRIDEDRRSVTFRHPTPRRQTHDPLNAICALSVEMLWSRLRQHPTQLCLHAAGVEIAGALIAFPAARRAGKSTLSALLAQRGHRVFSDDVLPLDTAGAAGAVALGNGIAPRLRLPLPAGAPEEFRAWVARDPGPANAQYKYLTGAPIAAFDTPAPLRAIVCLDRRAEATQPQLSDMPPEDVMPLLIHQNFGRFAHSGQVLQALGALVRTLPCKRLSYSDLAAAARCLEDAVANETLLGRTTTTATPAAMPGPAPPPRAAFDPAMSLRRAAGFSQVDLAGEAYVADAAGVGIFQLNQSLAAIWALLETPITRDEIVTIMAAHFRDIPAATLHDDATAALTQLWQAGLIEPA